MAVSVDIKQLLEAGAHFGHKTSRWHPKMAPYIHSKRGDAHIINLEKTVEALESALPEITKAVASGKKVLFVGTKKQMKEIVKTAAEEVKMPYVTVRWMGGMLTNTETISKQVKKLVDLERKIDSGELVKRYSKLEVLKYQEEIDALREKYAGIAEMKEQPALLIVADILQDKNAVAEAKVLNIPVVALVDTNANPAGIDHVIPANDDAISAVKLIFDYFVEAVKAGQKKAA
jgi:small subunit ribosomal protein S2